MKHSDQEQIRRIEEMERRFARTSEAYQQLCAALEKYEAAQEDLHVLSKYYGSKEWWSDLKADESGLLPDDLKRGVLSEDGIWDLLDGYREMKKILK